MSEILAFDTSTLVKDMELVREYCRMGRRVRDEVAIPVSYPLKEIEINSVAHDWRELGWNSQEQHFLWKSLYELIGEELNVRDVNPFLTNHIGDTNWVSLKEGQFEIALNVSKSPEQEVSFLERRGRREEAIKRKGIPYGNRIQNKE